jgi:excisionase family DNA binding protein
MCFDVAANSRQIHRMTSDAQWIRISEAAKIAHVTERTIRRWLSVYGIRATRPAGGRRLVDERSLRAFLAGSRDA